MASDRLSTTITKKGIREMSGEMDEDIKAAIINQRDNVMFGTGSVNNKQYHSNRHGVFSLSASTRGLYIRQEDGFHAETYVKYVDFAKSLKVINSKVNRYSYGSFDCWDCVVIESNKEGFDEQGNLHIKK